MFMILLLSIISHYFSVFYFNFFILSIHHPVSCGGLGGGIHHTWLFTWKWEATLHPPPLLFSVYKQKVMADDDNDLVLKLFQVRV